RVQVSERERGRSTLRISDLRENAPKLPSVSVSPSAEIVEGSSVTLTCSSDANPAAKYTWFKENLLKGQGQSYYFPSIRSEDRGIYYCQAENKHGQIKSLQHLLDVQCKSHSVLLIVLQKFFQIMNFNTNGSSIYNCCPPDAPKLPSVSVSPSAEIVEQFSDSDL
uniref:Ig-like domain-containing protein n=1 Tax=Labrus bergylta TaxID=56723 RepID=A0A3Q3E5H5_9LABR